MTPEDRAVADSVNIVIQASLRAGLASKKRMAEILREKADGLKREEGEND